MSNYEIITLSVLEASTGVVPPGTDVLSPHTVLESTLANQGIEQFPPALVTTGSFETMVPPTMVESLRYDMASMMQGAGCPVTPSPVYVVQPPNAAPLEPIAPLPPGFKTGYYYRVPVSVITSNGEPLPEYSTMFGISYAAMVYPPGDIYEGLMIVKALEPISTIPAGVTEMHESDVSTEIQRLSQAIFAM